MQTGFEGLDDKVGRYAPPERLRVDDFLTTSTAGWGPVGEPDKYRDIPYALFNKSDRLGKAADFITTRYGDQRRAERGIESIFGYQENEEENFHIVDSRSVGRSRPFRGGRRRHQGGQRRNVNEQQPQQLTRQDKRILQQAFVGKKWNRNYARPSYHRVERIREASIEISGSWRVVEQIDFDQFNRLTFSPPGGQTITTRGKLAYYNKSYDKVTTKASKFRPLQKIPGVPLCSVTTSDDPVIRELAQNGSEDKTCVYSTDVILTVLMTATRSINPWDIIVRRIGKKIFFDKREKSNIDLQTVYETAREPPQEEKPGQNYTPAQAMNLAGALAVEATAINKYFSEQVLSNPNKEPKELEGPDPFVEDEGKSSRSGGYFYRKFDLGDGIELVCRSEIDGTMEFKGENQNILVRALNEYDSKATGGIDWRQKLDSQQVAVFANEVKNNSCKLARWTIQALLAGCEAMKIGYVSRANPKDNNNHVILGTYQYKPQELAGQINFSLNNVWGVLKALIMTFRELPEGDYLLMRDPNKNMLRLYEVPVDDVESL